MEGGCDSFVIAPWVQLINVCSKVDLAGNFGVGCSGSDFYATDDPLLRCSPVGPMYLCTVLTTTSDMAKKQYRLSAWGKLQKSSPINLSRHDQQLNGLQVAELLRKRLSNSSIRLNH